MEMLNTIQFSDLDLVKGEGCWMWDKEGVRYLDLLAGTWSNVLGHCHPVYTRRIQSQLERLVHLGSREISFEIFRACECLSDVLPGEMGHVTFLSTGSEAVELAIKIARITTGRQEIVGCRQGYYGATSQALALSEFGSKVDNLRPFQTSYIDRIPAPTCHNCSFGSCYPQCQYLCLTSWFTEIESRNHHQVAAILLEPVIASNVIVPPQGYLAKLSEIAAKWDCLIIADEVTTGLGRTGKWFGFQQDGFIPDILVLGKALGNGLPVSAVITTGKVAQACNGLLWHVQSHQNDPLAGVAAATVIEIIRKESLIENVKKMGMFFLDGLKRLQKERPGIRGVRGTGLMVALELSGEKKAERGARIFKLLRQRGAIVDYRPAVATFRFFPPYVITKLQLDLALEILADGLKATEELFFL